MVSPSTPSRSLTHDTFTSASLFIPLVVYLILLRRRNCGRKCQVSSTENLTHFGKTLTRILSSTLVVITTCDILYLLLLTVTVVHKKRGYARKVLTTFLPTVLIGTMLIVSITLRAIAVCQVADDTMFDKTTMVVKFIVDLALCKTCLRSPAPSLQ